MVFCCQCSLVDMLVNITIVLSIAVLKPYPHVRIESFLEIQTIRALHPLGQSALSGSLSFTALGIFGNFAFLSTLSFRALFKMFCILEHYALLGTLPFRTMSR